MSKTINSCIDVLKQAENFLQSIDDDSYTKIMSPYFISSAGEHMRHILDHFIAIQCSQQNNIINYDQRQRGSRLEYDINAALTQLLSIEDWLLTLTDKDLDKTLLVQTEVSINSTEVTQANSSLKRELVFASSHAVHHYASMAISLQLQDFQVDNSFGIAAATATALRQ